MRGFGSPPLTLTWPHRFIPACAGFWRAFAYGAVLYVVHPRMCGVLYCYYMLANVLQGSSPHVRGFVIAGIRDAHDIRFIPACAGF